MIYIVSHYWDTPDNEGHEVLGAYHNEDDAKAQMIRCANAVKAEWESYKDEDPWDEDYSWETDYEIHLGFDSKNAFEPATFYCWVITPIEVV